MRDLIRAAIEAQGLTGDYQAIADALNTKPLVDNPTERATVAVRVTLAEAFDAMQPADAIAVLDNANPQLLKWIEEACTRGDTAAIGKYVSILAAKGWLSLASRMALDALMQRTEPDPAWSAQVPGQSWAEANVGRPVTAADVQAALVMG